MKNILVVGKGGVGKTTVSAVIATVLPQGSLVVDGDPEMTLHDSLFGGELEITPLSTLMDELDLSPAALRSLDMSLGEYVKGRAVQENVILPVSIVGNPMNYIVMGRDESEGCYCSVNNALRKFLDTVSYPYRLIDCPAGSEHVSRNRVAKIDTLVGVANDKKSQRILLSILSKLTVRPRQIIYVHNRFTADVEQTFLDVLHNYSDTVSFVYAPNRNDLESIENDGGVNNHTGSFSTLRDYFEATIAS